MRIVELSRSTSAPITFFVGGPKFTYFFVKRGSDGGQSSLFPIVDVLFLSGDIRDQTLKLFKIARTVDFGCVNIHPIAAEIQCMVFRKSRFSGYNWT